MPTSINAQLKAAESGMGMPLQLLAAAVFCTIFGPFFTAVLSFIASILALAASFSSGQACCGGGNSTGEDWSEAKRSHLKSSCCCDTPRSSSVSQLFAWTALFAILNVIGSSVQAGYLLGCSDDDDDYYYDHYQDDYYYMTHDDGYGFKSACQGYSYDFDLILGVKPQNSGTSSSTPFSYCTEDHVTKSLGKKIVNLWMEEQELLDGEDVEYCEHFPTSWTVPASSYADLLEGTNYENEHYMTCVEHDFMNMFFMDFMDSCNENDESDEDCSLTDEMLEQCTSSNVNQKVQGTDYDYYHLCYKCNAMTVSGVTGCYCSCGLEEDENRGGETPEKVFSWTESDIMVVAQFQNYYFTDYFTDNGYYDYHDHPDGCWLGELSNIFGIFSLLNAIFSFLLSIFAMRKRSQWAQLGFTIKKSEEGNGGMQMMNMTPMSHGGNFGGGGNTIHPMNSAVQRPQGGGMFVQLPNGQIGQMVPLQPAAGMEGGMMAAAGGQGVQGCSLRQTVLHAPTTYQPTLVATAVAFDDGSVKM
ncbi:hypothetical protein TrLO_g655 [Triparma laevis f. longispina]|uniref:Uncharacterized protein n=1 Tax=Triparma laevis f. longispina TaxID=1714387 RepID=A0A9W7KZ63_9STRA|nr:hypothetical protein TrLO_g655 [Triparma laevis f. longispina]